MLKCIYNLKIPAKLGNFQKQTLLAWKILYKCNFHQPVITSGVTGAITMNINLYTGWTGSIKTLFYFHSSFWLDMHCSNRSDPELSWTRWRLHLKSYTCKFGFCYESDSFSTTITIVYCMQWIRHGHVVYLYFKACLFVC